MRGRTHPDRKDALRIFRPIFASVCLFVGVKPFDVAQALPQNVYDIDPAVLRSLVCEVMGVKREAARVQERQAVLEHEISPVTGRVWEKK